MRDQKNPLGGLWCKFTSDKALASTVARLPMSARTSTEDFPRNGLQWAHALDGTELNRLLGHAEDDAGGFVLGHSPSARLPHFEQSARTVVAHAGHDDS